MFLTCFLFTHSPWWFSATPRRRVPAGSFASRIASLVALLLQKADRCFVSTAITDPAQPDSFSHLLDILLSNDFSVSKPLPSHQRTLFGSWWRRWRKGSDIETSSSEFYQSASDDLTLEAKPVGSVKEGVVVSSKEGVMTSSKEGTVNTVKEIVKQEDSHPKEYFDAIHTCLDGLVTEINAAELHAVISSHLLTIVHPLLYTHRVVVVPKEDLKQGVSAIQTYQKAMESASSLDSASASKGDHLLVLTETKLLLLSPRWGSQEVEMSQDRSASKEVEDSQEMKSSQEGELSQEGNPSPQEGDDTCQITEEETEAIQRIVDSLDVFTSCIEDAEQRDWTNCDSYTVQFVMNLSDIQLLNILVGEETEEKQTIHIKVSEDNSLFLQVDYSIFVVNELMNRIGHLHCVRLFRETIIPQTHPLPKITPIPSSAIPPLSSISNFVLLSGIAKTLSSVYVCLEQVLSPPTQIQVFYTRNYFIVQSIIRV